MEENNIENSFENKVENSIPLKENFSARQSQSQIAGAIIIAGIIIAGAVLLKGSGIPTVVDPVKHEAELTKAMPVFSSCLDSGKYLQAVTDSKAGAITAGVNATPKGFILKNGNIVATIDGAEPFETVKQKIDKALTPNNKIIGNITLNPISSSDFTTGNPQAEVALVMYEDFQCPFCGRFFSDSEKSIRDTYVKNGVLQLVYRDFAFLGPESIKASEAARCARDQGKFWEYHDYLFAHQNGENQGNFSSLNLKLFAKELKLK